jgi:hypothetical protein
MVQVLTCSCGATKTAVFDHIDGIAYAYCEHCSTPTVAPEVGLRFDVPTLVGLATVAMIVGATLGDIARYLRSLGRDG